MYSVHDGSVSDTSLAREAGFDDCYWQPHLDLLILKSIGLDNVSDETFRAYDDILDKRAEKVEDNNDSIMKQVMKTYFEIRQLKKKLRGLD